jgi:hypothetical protein
MNHQDGQGVPPEDLAQTDLLRELLRLHATRNETLRHGSPDSLMTHTRRQGELEDEYVRRFPDREIEAGRLRAGARAR